MQDNNILIEKNQHHNDFMSHKYDWHNIKREYVEGHINEDDKQTWPTMKKLSLKYGIPPAYLRRIASAQKWTIEKTNYVTNYEHSLQAEKIHYLAQKSAKFDGKCIKIAEEGIKKIENLLFNANIILENGTKVIFPLDDLELAAKTLEKFQKIGRLALGNSTDNVTKSIKAATESISFSDGLNTVMKQIKSNPELLKKLELEFIDE